MLLPGGILLLGLSHREVEEALVNGVDVLQGRFANLYDLFQRKPVEGPLRCLLDFELLVVLLSNFCFRYGGWSRQDRSRNGHRILRPEAVVP